MSPSPRSREIRIRPDSVAAATTFSVRCADQALLSDGIDVVADAGQYGGRRDGQVLVELELHRDCGSGSSSSRASAAP